MLLKLKIFSIVCLVTWRRLVWGKAVTARGEIRKVIIFQSGKLGDSICATPVFRAVKNKFPDCKVVIVGNPLSKLIHQYNSDVDSFIAYDEKKFFDTIENIRAEKADYACLLSPSAFGLGALFLSGIPLIVAPVVKSGWSPYETKAYKIMSHFVRTVEYVMGNYVPREYLKVLEPIDIFTDDVTKHVFWSAEATVKMNALIADIEKKQRIPIGIMPGAGNKIKEWPPERFAAVADHLITTHNAHIFIIGSEANRNEIDTMIAHVQNTEHVTDSSWTTLDEMKALVSMMRMTVSVDTGPVFIAEACGVPTIDIGGVIHPNDMAPNDGKFHILITYDGEPLLWSLNSRVYDYAAARTGIESITVDTVVREIDTLLEKISLRDGAV